MDTLPDATCFVVLMFNLQGLTVAVGQPDGQPFSDEPSAEDFAAKYRERYPNVHTVALPLQPAALDS